jgi:Predicted integral membrane protein (DUF2269)
VTYPLLKFVHLLGLTLMGAGLIGVWYADLRSRQARDLPLLAEAIQAIAVFYEGLVVPGALLLLGSGSWLIVMTYGGLGLVVMRFGPPPSAASTSCPCRGTSSSRW